MDNQKDFSISVFFPAYNDEKTIPKLIQNTKEVLKPYTEDYEIIVVDDCSPDNVGQIADDIASKDPKVKVVHHEKNKGYGGALKSGFAAATKDYVFYTDGDAQFDVKELPKLLQYKDEYDIVNGNKKNRGDQIHRLILGKAYHHFACFMFGIKVNDIDCAFKLFKTNVIKGIDIKSDGGFIAVEMWHKLHKKKHTIKEIPVSHYDREFGESQFFSVNRIVQTVTDFFGSWWNLVIKEKFR